MTLSEYNNLKQKLSFINSKISYNFAFLDSRWLERKINNDNDITYIKDNENLNNIYNYYDEIRSEIKKYIR